MNYLIIGTGGVGGTIASFLELAGKEVTCIARGENLQAIRNDGLSLHSELKGVHENMQLTVFSPDEYMKLQTVWKDDKRPDIIILSVKAFSVEEVLPLIRVAAKQNTMVIPVENVFGFGKHLQQALPDITCLDGCIYFSGFKEAPGIVHQLGRVFHLIFGATIEQRIPAQRLEQVATDLRSSGIEVSVSDDIRRDTFIKWGYTSAVTSACAFHGCTMGALQHPGPERQTLCGLIRESYAVGNALDIAMPADYMLQNLSLVDHADPDYQPSLSRDLEQHHQSEIRYQMFALDDLGRQHGVDMTTYDRVCDKFKSLRQ